MPEQKYIFILGHMRSYSTLLSHIMGSHPEISGYTELHQSYQHPNDFQTMRQKITFAYEKKISTPFLLDKILHNRYNVNPTFLQAPQLKILFLIRQPEMTLKSIIQMGHDIERMKRFGNPNAALYYYENRLLQLINYATNIRKSMLFIEGEKVLQQSETTLETIRSFLGLNTPLTCNYSTYKLTGKLFYGDSSPEISSGKIIVKTKKRSHNVIPQDVLNRAQECYEACKTAIVEHSVV